VSVDGSVDDQEVDGVEDLGDFEEYFEVHWVTRTLTLAPPETRY
jgi:hypothetical protein